MNTFSVTPVDWFALSPGIGSRDEWQRWVKDGCVWPEPSPVKAESVPAGVRRRISSLCKMGLQTALTLCENRQIDYAVFSSRHGEMTRTTGLLRDILSGSEASPTAFSQSVHNATAGLFTIIGSRPVPVTSIAAGHDGFHMGLIDAYAYLVQHPADKVLLIDFDEALPSPYGVYDDMPYPGHALGLLLESGNLLSCRGFRSESQVKPLLPQALDFLTAYLSTPNEWVSESPRHHWHWTRRST